MKRFLTITASALLGFVPGYLFFHGGTPGHESIAPSSPPATTAGARKPKSAQAIPEAHTFENLLKAFKQQWVGPPIRAQLERLSNLELREWATQDWPADPPPATGGSPKRLILLQIANLLYEREGMAAIEWADQQTKDLREIMFGAMVLKAAENDPIAAKPWVDKVLKDYGKVSNYANAALGGARKRGAEDLAKVYEIYPGLEFSSFGYDAFADDFDFKKFTELNSGKRSIPSVYTAWASRDAEAAAADVITRCGNDPNTLRYTGALFAGVAAVRGDQEAAQWIVGKLSEIPTSKRADAVKSLRGNAMLSGSEVAAVLTALPTQEDRLLYASEVISPFGNPAATRQAIAAFPTVEAKTDLLLKVVPQYRSAAANSRNRGGSNDPVKFFQTTMEELNLPEASRQQVIDSLMTPPEPR